MKNRTQIAKRLDTVLALVETLLFVCIPEVWDDTVLIQVLAYVVIVTLKLCYIIWLRKKVIDILASPTGIDTGCLLKATCAENLRERVVPQICKLMEIASTEPLFRYEAYLEWVDAATFVAQHFWCEDSIINVEMDKTTRFVRDRVYKGELKQIINCLIQLHNQYRGFYREINLFGCETLQHEIETLYNSIVQIGEKLDKGNK